MDEKRGKYIKIPVSMIPELYRGASGVRDVVLYSLCRKADEMDYDPSNVAKRIVYEAMRENKDKMKVSFPAVINAFLKGMAAGWGVNELSELDVDYRGFHPELGGDFRPLTYDDDYNEIDVIEAVEDGLKENPSLWDMAVRYYRIGQVANLLHIKVLGIDEIFGTYEKYKRHNQCKAWAWGNFDKLGELYNRGNNLIAEDIEVYAGNLAFKSIIGKKTVGRTESKLVLARMAGCVSTNDCTSLYLEDNPLAARVYKRYSDKENFRRLTGRLRDGYVTYIETIPGKNRLGTFFSFSRDLGKYSFEEEVMKIVEADKKEKAKIKKRMQRRKKRTGCRPAKGMDLKAHQAPPGLPF